MISLKVCNIAELKNDVAFAETCRSEAAKLKQNIHDNAWDGEWFRRAYFDDGTPLGSHENEECRIDSIAQSWSVLSGGGEQERSLTAMKSANKFLVKEDVGIIQLFTPPFDKSHEPGNIKLRTGFKRKWGQYTHAALAGKGFCCHWR